MRVLAYTVEGCLFWRERASSLLRFVILHSRLGYRRPADETNEVYVRMCYVNVSNSDVRHAVDGDHSSGQIRNLWGCDTIFQ